MSIAASSAERPRQGDPAECAVAPLNLNCTDQSALPPACPHDMPQFELTWVKRFTSTPSKTPSRTK